MMNSGPGNNNVPPIRLATGASGSPGPSSGAPSASVPSPGGSTGTSSSTKTHAAPAPMPPTVPTQYGLSASDLIAPALSPIDRFNNGPRADLQRKFIEAIREEIRNKVFDFNVAIPNLPQADQKALADAAERMREGNPFNPLKLNLSNTAIKVADALSGGEYKSGFKRESKNIDLLIEALTPEAKGLAFRNPGEGFEEQQARQQLLLDNLRKSMLENRDAKGDSCTDLLINTPKIDDEIKAANLDPTHVKAVLRSDLEKGFASTATQELSSSLETLRTTLLWNCLNIPADAVDLHLSQKQLDLYARAARVSPESAQELHRIEEANLKDESKGLGFYKRAIKSALATPAIAIGASAALVHLMPTVGPLIPTAVAVSTATVAFGLYRLHESIINRWKDSVGLARDNALGQGTRWDNSFGWATTLLRMFDHRRNPTAINSGYVKWFMPGHSDSIDLMKRRILQAAKFGYETSRQGEGLLDPNKSLKTATNTLKDNTFDENLKLANQAIDALGTRWSKLPRLIGISATVATIPGLLWTAGEWINYLGFGLPPP